MGLSSMPHSFVPRLILKYPSCHSKQTINFNNLPYSTSKLREDLQINKPPTISSVNRTKSCWVHRAPRASIERGKKIPYVHRVILIYVFFHYIFKRDIYIVLAHQFVEEDEEYTSNRIKFNHNLKLVKEKTRYICGVR